MSEGPEAEAGKHSSVAADALRLFIERIERLEEEKKGIGDDIKDVYAEAKATGYDVKIMRQTVRLRKMEPHERKEQEALLETYLIALGMADETPDMFAGHGGPAEPKPDPVMGSARGGKSFKQEVSEKIIEHFEGHDDGHTDVTITTGDGATAFESKAAKARKAKATASAVH